MNQHSAVVRWRICVWPLNDSGAAGQYGLSKEYAGGLRIRLLALQDSVVTTSVIIGAYLFRRNGRSWWLIGRPKILGSGSDGRGLPAPELFPMAILVAFKACLGQDVAPNHIVTNGYDLFGLSAEKWGLREFKPAEAVDAPSLIQEAAAQKLFCLDEQNMRLASLTDEFLKDAQVEGRIDEKASLNFFEQKVLQARTTLQAIKKLRDIELEIVTLDETWEQGETGGLIKEVTGSLDGICARVLSHSEDVTERLGRARAYHLLGRNNRAGDDWWLMGDPMVAGAVRGNGLHEKLYFGRVARCFQLDVPANRIAWAPGRFAYKAGGFGFREMYSGELANAPEAVLRLAERSRESNPVLRTGLYCFDEKHRHRALTVAAETVMTRKISWQGLHGTVSWYYGPRWQSMLSQMRRVS